MTRMKESSIDWIGQIPEEWEIVKFKYLFNTSKGLSITKEYLVDEGIPVINYGQIHSSLTKQVQSCDDRLPFVANYYLSKKGVKLNQGDFVFADTSEDLEGAGNFSTRLDSTGQLLAGYHTIIARLNDYDEHDFRYFMHLFDSLAIRKQIQNKVSGVKVYSVTQGILNSIFVIIPPKNEQQKIADFLDKKTAQLDKVKALLEEQIQKLKDYRASLIYETVTKGLDKTVPMKDSGIDWIGQVPEGWEMVKFKYFFNTSKGLSITKECLVDEGIPVINYGQIHSSMSKQVQSCDVRLPFVPDYYLSKKGANLNQGDFVFADTSEDLEGAGNFSTRIDSTGPLLAGYHTIIARLNNYDEYDFRYFMHLFDSLAIRKQIQNKVSGIKVYSITQGILNSIFVIIPPKSEQQKIANLLDEKTAQIDKLVQIKNQQIENINKQRQTLIYDYVTGKRRV